MRITSAQIGDQWNGGRKGYRSNVLELKNIDFTFYKI